VIRLRKSGRQYPMDTADPSQGKLCLFEHFFKLSRGNKIV